MLYFFCVISITELEDLTLSYPLTAIILAAGLSRRFHSNKLLYPLEGKPLFRHLLDTITQLEWDQLILISSYDEIQHYAQSQGITYIHNDHQHAGLAYSIKLAIQAKKESNHSIFFTADTPYLSASTIQALINRFKEVNRIAIITPTFQGQYYQPNLFHQAFSPDLLELQGDKGGKILFHRYPDALIPLEVTNPKELLDIDTLSDLPSS